MSRFLPISYATRNLGRSRTRLALAVGGALLVSLLAMGGAGFAIGMDRALRELCRVVAPGGLLYLSVPVGRERVAFNAHRISDAEGVVRKVADHGLTLCTFAYVDDGGRFHDPARPEEARGLDYGCGCFLFERPAQ